MDDREKQTSPADLLSIDTVFDLLRDSRRRTVLARLTTCERKSTVNDLADEIAVRERDAPITDVPDEELTRIAISLHHVHIPKLADAGLVEYDRERRVVEPTEELDRVKPHLPPASEADSVRGTSNDRRE